MNLENFFTALNEWIARLNGLEAGALVYVSCIILGYIIRTVAVIPNQVIPAVVIISGPLLNVLLLDEFAGRVHVVRAVLVGLALGAFSWASHHFVIAHLEDWIKAKIGSKGEGGSEK